MRVFEPTLSRRTFLRGAGAALALPLLDGLPAWGRPEEDLPLRLVYVYAPNGKHMPQWTPAEEGWLSELPGLLQPLRAHRERLLVISGLEVDGARAHGDGPGDHARALAAYLTCRHPRKTAGADLRAGISADQVAAKHLSGLTPFPSLELGLEPSQIGGSCDSGYSCAYSSNIAWRSESQPLVKETDPRTVFERLFRPHAGSSPEERARRRRQRGSLLDLVGEDAERVRGKLGRTDRRKLEEYLDAVREVERRLEHEDDAAEQVPEPELPKDLRRHPGQHARAMFDVLTLALQSDATRVATFTLGNEGSNRSYPNLDIPEGHHYLSHHGGDEDKRAKIRRINLFHLTQLDHFLDRLAAVPEGDGTLLDHTLVVYGSGIGDGNRHDHHDLPILIAGGGKVIRGGRHLTVPRRTPLANLHLALLQLLGVRATRFGDSTGALVGLNDAPSEPRPTGKPRRF